MNPRDFLRKLHDAQIVQAIRDAESKTSGEIRVFVDPRPETDPLTAAQRRFGLLGMDRTRLRNGVLVYLAPTTQAFAVIGDAGLHARCETGFWEGVAERMAARLRTGDYTGALVETVEVVGARLAEHFPREPDDRNELPDRVIRG